MSGSANQFFPVTAAVINTGTNGLSFAGLFQTDDPIVPINTKQSVLRFTSIADVGNFFGLSSLEYDAATKYFNGYDGSFNKPAFILFARYVDVISSAYIQGNKVTATIAAFNLITAGAITFNINGVAYPITGIDLSGLTSYSAIAAAILAAFETAHVADFPDASLLYSSSTRAFAFDTGLTTGDDTIDWCSNSALAALMGFQTTPATALTILPNTGYLSQGSIVLSFAQNMALATGITKNFASFTNVFNVDSDTGFLYYQAAAQYANDNGYMFAQYNNVSAAIELSWNDILVTNNWASVSPNYGTLGIAAFAMGTGASINYNAANSVIAWAFKSQSGLLPSVTDDTTYTALKNVNVNCYFEVSNQSDDFIFYQQGRITGQFKFIQNFYNQMWLGNAIQSALLRLWGTAPIIDYSPQGYQKINNTLSTVMARALNNGTASINNVLSASQIALLTQQAGQDISQEMINNGYYIKIEAVDGDGRAANIPPPTTIWYINGGVILTLPVTTVFVL